MNRPTPFEIAIDKHVRCMKCGAGLGKCSCWVKLRCPKCKKEQSTERKPEDKEADLVEIMCPDCCGDF